MFRYLAFCPVFACPPHRTLPQFLFLFPQLFLLSYHAPRTERSTHYKDQSYNCACLRLQRVLFLSDFQRYFNCIQRGWEKFPLRNFSIIRPAGAEFFHADGQTHIRAEAVVHFRDYFTNAPKMHCI